MKKTLTTEQRDRLNDLRHERDMNYRRKVKQTRDRIDERNRMQRDR